MNTTNELKQELRVYDNYNFHYEVDVIHSPHLGFSTAYYHGRVVAQCDFQKLHQPYSDSDSEWEFYEEKLNEWKDEVNGMLKRACSEYFSR